MPADVKKHPPAAITVGDLAALKVQFSLLEAYASTGDVSGAEACRRAIQELAQGLERRADALIQRAEKRWRERDPSPTPEAA